MIRYLYRLALYFHTIRYLKACQVFWRIRYRLTRPHVDRLPAPKLRVASGVWCLPSRREPSMLGATEFCFLAQSRLITLASDWDRFEWDKLWRYNLHYFDDLNARDASMRRVWHRALIARWIVENPPGQGTGWEPYPISVRVVNWIKWALAGNVLDLTALDSLATQVRWLGQRLEYHLLGNHLFVNAKALIFAGLFFEGEEANGWLKTGLEILDRELHEQVLPDGGQFERSPMYHALALEDLVDLINVARVFSGLIPSAILVVWRDTASRMLYWLGAMCHPDGEIVLFNDAAFGVAPTWTELEAYASRLGFTAIPYFGRLVVLKDSGYVRLEIGPMVAFLDVAPIGPDYLPGHAHADTLTFELSLFGQRMFVDSGTDRYGNGVERLRQRSTAAHNTVVVNAQDSSEVWNGFRVARRAYPSQPVVEQVDGKIVITASHDGYRRLPGKNVHQRRWILAPDVLCIQDNISGPFEQAQARFYLHPSVQVEAHDALAGKLTLRLPQGQVVQVGIVGTDSFEIEPATWHPAFGMIVPNLCISVKLNSDELTTRIAWQGGPC